MAPTAAVLVAKVPGSRKSQTGDLTLDTNYNNTGVYATSGYAITPALFPNFVSLESIIFHTLSKVTAAIGDFAFDPATNNLHIFSAAGTELANAADASSVSIRYTISGY